MRTGKKRIIYCSLTETIFPEITVKMLLKQLGISN